MSRDTRLVIDDAAVQEIKRHGVETFPDECCGFLLGRAEPEGKRVSGLHPVANAFVDGERYHRFLITPRAYLEGERSAREHGLDVLGFYHSHPNAPARPSPYDLDHAWPWYSYVILAVAEAGAQEMTAWVLADDRSVFHPEPFDISI